MHSTSRILYFVRIKIGNLIIYRMYVENNIMGGLPVTGGCTLYLYGNKLYVKVF